MTLVRRRQRLGAEQRREQIMAATVVVLARSGFQGTSADAIAQEAEVSKGLLWHYFGSQDELFAETARRTLLVLRGAVGSGIDLTAPVPELVRAAVRGAASLRHTHAAERRAMREILANLRTPDGRDVLTLDDYDDTYAAQEAIFRRGQEEGDLRPDLDPRLLAVTYQGSVDSMLAYLDAHPEVDEAAYAELVADVLLGGMATSSGSGTPSSPRAPRRSRTAAR